MACAHAMLSTLVGYQRQSKSTGSQRAALATQRSRGDGIREWLSFDAQPPTRTIDMTLCEKLANAQKAALSGPDSVRTHEGARAVVDLANKLGWPIFAEATSGVRFGRSIHTSSPPMIPFFAVLRSMRLRPVHRTAWSCLSIEAFMQWIARHADSEYICISEGDEFVCPERMPASTVKGRVEACS